VIDVSMGVKDEGDITYLETQSIQDLDELPVCGVHASVDQSHSLTVNNMGSSEHLLVEDGLN
jgi:hypothetical protein